MQKKRGKNVSVKPHKRGKSGASRHTVQRDSKTGQFVTKRSDKNAQVLAATVGGAVIGNIIVPGLGGAVVGAIAGALLGNSSDEGSKNE